MGVCTRVGRHFLGQSSGRMNLWVKETRGGEERRRGKGQEGLWIVLRGRGTERRLIFVAMAVAMTTLRAAIVILAVVYLACEAF